MPPKLLLERQNRLLKQLARLEDDLRDNAADLAEAIRQKRDALGLCTRELAERTGLPYTSVVNWVYGNNMIPEKAAKKLLQATKARPGPVPSFRRTNRRKLLTR
jgi:DNA-binding transcriptional regulator YiaG